MKTPLTALFTTLLVSLFVTTSAIAEDALPEVSHDGLHLLHDTKLRAVYMKPGANLDEYDEVALLACYVAFNKHWQRNYNDQTIDLANRVSDADMKKIRDTLSAEFNKVFTKVLEKGGHPVVTKSGKGVLIVQPAIVNLEITSPDTMAPMDQSFSADAGQMTLYAQLYDGRTGDIIARIIDPEAAGDDTFEVRNSVTNLADAERVMQRWAEILNKHLEDLKAATTAKK
jgi:hypothetical protein